MNNILKDLPEEAKQKINKKAMPVWTAPMLATLTHDYFSSTDWIYERKLDGQRCLFFKSGNDVRLMSRNKKKQNNFYPEIADAVQALPGDFILDGELVTFDGSVTSFSKLQNRMHVQNPGEELIRDYPVYVYLFDCLYLDGYDLTALPLRYRKSILKKSIKYNDPVRYLPHRKKDGEKYLEEACKKGWEGLIAKNAKEKYVHSRSACWLKFKCNKGQEFVIGGYTAPKGERVGFGALLVGYYKDNDLIYAGKVGTGYNDKFLEKFHQRMEKCTRKTCPFKNFDGQENNVTWISPQFVGEVGFTEWTNDGKLRHPRFLGLRKDKTPEDVVREDKHVA